MKKLESVEQYKQVINQKAMLMFSADWCPDCRFIDPIMPEIEEKYNEYTFFYVDRDKFLDLCGELAIFGIPSFIAYNNGKELGRFVNKHRKTKEEIEKFIQELAE